jgi:cytochrome c oxidase subunit II
MRWSIRATRGALLLAFGVAVGSCAGPTSALRPQGPAAAHIADLWWVMFALAAIIFVGVTGFLAFALFRRQSAEFDEDASTTQPSGGTRLIVGGGIIMPAVVLVGVFGFTLWTMNVLNAYARETAMTVQVTGHQWWWEVRYPEQGFATANEIHIPIGQPVRIELASADVVHNFWVPELHGKIDMVPGKINTFWLQADEPGVYRGKCAEYCGTQHAKMEFVVVADPPEQFAAWLGRQQLPASQPSDALALQGQQVFLGSTCVQCHAVRGTDANSTIGPDLTHLASRRTLGAGVLENNLGNLAGWITNPHSVKPGNKMPPVVLDPKDLNALLAYLATLE